MNTHPLPSDRLPQLGPTQCADLHGLCIRFTYYLHSCLQSPPWLELLPQCLFMQNLLTSPAVHPPSSWGGGLNWESGLGLYTPLYLNFLSLPYPSSRIPLLPKTPQPRSSKQTWGAGSWSSSPECQPRTLRGWRRTGPFTLPVPGRKRGLLGPPRPGTMASASKGHSWTIPPGECGAPAGW